jgi:PST family polysaccharide transporter
LNVFISRSLNELILNGGYIVLGLTATNTVVGLYYFAFRLAAQPVRIMAGNFHYVLFPALAQLRTDQAQQGATALQAARVLAAVVMPLCFLQAALADPVLHIIASAQWHDSIPMAQILSLGLPFDAVSWIALALINARGQFKRSLIFTAVSSASFLALAGAGALIASGIGVSVAVSLYYTLQGPIYSKLVFGNATTFRRLIGDVYGLPALISGVSIGFAYALSLAPFLHDAQIARFLLIAALGLGMNLLIFWRVRPVLLAEIIRRLGGGRFARIAGMKRLSAYLGTPG